jgi:hypothetical protein
MDIPVDELVIARRGLDGDADRRRDHMHDGLPVEDDVRPVLGRPFGRSGAYRPTVKKLAVVGDGHLVSGQVDDGYVAVTDYERRRYSPFAPGSAADVPAVEVAVDFDLVANGPVRGGPEVELDRTEPVPAARHWLAHGDGEVGLDGLLSGQGVDRLGEHEDDRLAYTYRDPRRREDARSNDAGRRRCRETPRALGAERGLGDRSRTGIRARTSACAQYCVMDRIGRAWEKLARRAPLVAGCVQRALQLVASRQDRHMHALEPGTVGAKGDH